MALISVIIPNYNHARYLKQRIDGVLSQTFQDIEVIILDDCSTDHSREVIETYRNHPKVNHIVYNTSNSGSPFRQWKKGIDLAQSAFIWIAESDDDSSPDFITELFPCISNDNEVGIVYAQSLIMDEKNIVDAHFDLYYWTNDLDEEKWKENYVNEKSGEDLPFFCIRNIIPNASSLLFRKSYFYSIYDENIGKMSFAGDWLSWIKIAEISKIAFINKKLNYFRRHNHSTRIPAKAKSALKEKIQIRFYIFNKHKINIKNTKFWIELQKELLYVHKKSKCFGYLKELGNIAYQQPHFFTYFILSLIKNKIG